MVIINKKEEIEVKLDRKYYWKIHKMNIKWVCQKMKCASEKNTNNYQKFNEKHKKKSCLTVIDIV